MTDSTYSPEPPQRTTFFPREVIALEHGFEVEPRTATEHDGHTTLLKGLINLQEIVLILEDVVLLAWLHDVNEMIRHLSAMDGVVGKIFACTNIHCLIHLTGVGANDLSVYIGGKCGGEGSLSASRRTYDSYHHNLFLRFY